MSVLRPPERSERCLYPKPRPVRRERSVMQMPTSDRRILVAATLAVLLLGAVEIAVPVAGARDLPIRLYGSRTTGWGITNTSLSVPGPSLSVEVGDNVTLNLTSFDGNRHNW